MTGITASVSQTLPFGLGGGSGGETGTGTKATATHTTTKATGTAAGGGSGSGSTTSGSGGSSSSGQTKEDPVKPKSNTGVIVGAVVGIVAGLGLLGLAAFFVFRHARQNKNRPPGSNEFQQLDNLGPGGHGAGNNVNSISTNHGGPGELAGTPIGAGAAMLSADNAHSLYGAKPPLPPPSPSLSVSKYNNVVSPQSPPPNSISPVSAQQQSGGYGYPYGVPPPAGNQAELPGQMYTPTGGYPTSAAPSYSELQGQQTLPPRQQQSPPPPHAQAELYGGQPVYGYGQGRPYGAPPEGQPIYQADSTPIESPNRTTPSPGGGMTFHSGPVPQSYSELDASGNPHAR